MKFWDLCNLGIFLTRDPVEGVPDRVGSRNGYGYVEGNPVNRTDPSGECWVYGVTGPESNDNPLLNTQRATCRAVWDEYIERINQQFGAKWSDEVNKLVNQEARYWANLPYEQFIQEWNSDRPSPSTDPGGAFLVGGLATTLGLSKGNPYITLGLGACVLVAAAIAGTQAISLPARPIAKDTAEATAVPIPLDRVATPVPTPSSKCTHTPYASCPTGEDKLKHIFGEDRHNWGRLNIVHGKNDGEGIQLIERIANDSTKFSHAEITRGQSGIKCIYSDQIGPNTVEVVVYEITGHLRTISNAWVR